MDTLSWLASCLEQGRSAIAPALAVPGDRERLDRLKRIGALVQFQSRVVICPRCEAHAIEIVAVGEGACEDCGFVDVPMQYMQRLAPDGDWLRRRMAQALGFGGESALEIAPARVWHLGDVGRAGQRHRILFGQQLGSVLVQRVLQSAWPCYVGKMPAIMVTTTPENRVFLPGVPVKFVSLESAFRMRGARLVADESVWAAMLDGWWTGTVDDNRIGPFAHDFRDVILPGESMPIALTPSQGALMRVLWERRGVPMHHDDLVAAANVGVPKAIHAFQRQKYPEANRAYRALIRSDRQRRYWMLPV